MKSYKIKYKEEKHYLHVHTTGKEEYQNTIDIWTEVLGKCFELNYSKLLFVEETEQDHKNLIEMAELMAYARRLNAHLLDKIAFVDYISAHFKFNKFGELNVNSKGVNAKMFRDIEDAISWLTTD